MFSSVFLFNILNTDFHIFISIPLFTLTAEASTYFYLVLNSGSGIGCVGAFFFISLKKSEINYLPNDTYAIHR